MTKKPKDMKVGGVKTTDASESVKGTQSVGGVAGVLPTSGVGSVKGVGAVGKRRTTRVMTDAERDDLLRLIDEEAGKLFQGSGLTKEKQEVLKSAVKMAVDSGLINDKDKPKKE
ncbi:MAG: hypothetical protein K1X79_11810 [Oligoflexia bacterium]|nr:hypothetical protein [Oligoflexia bacterium]